MNKLYYYNFLMTTIAMIYVMMMIIIIAIRPNKVDTLIPVSARMPWWTPLKIFIIAKKFHYFLFEP